MFVIHTISSKDYFGAEKVLIDQCKAFIGSGNKILIIIISPAGDSPFLRKLAEEKLDYYHLASNTKIDLKCVFTLSRLIKSYRCDLIQSQGYKADIISLLASRLAGIPIITTIHGWTSEDVKVKLYEKIQAFSWRFFDMVICVCDFYRKKAQDFGVPTKKLNVVYNGITVCNQSPEKTKHGGLRIGIIGRLGKEKGHRYFLEAAAEVLEKNSTVNFMIIGEGLERDNIERLILQLGIPKSISLLGYASNMQSIYAELDIIAVPSLREGLPNVVLEAMLYEKAIVASRVGGIPEVIRDGQEGILVEPRDSDALADALIRLITDVDLRQKLCDNAKKRVIEDFSFEKRMEKIQELYLQVIKEHKKR